MSIFHKKAGKKDLKLCLPDDVWQKMTFLPVCQPSILKIETLALQAEFKPVFAGAW